MATSTSKSRWATAGWILAAATFIALPGVAGLFPIFLTPRLARVVLIVIVAAAVAVAAVRTLRRGPDRRRRTSEENDER